MGIENNTLNSQAAIIKHLALLPEKINIEFHKFEMESNFIETELKKMKWLRELDIKLSDQLIQIKYFCRCETGVVFFDETEIILIYLQWRREA